MTGMRLRLAEPIDEDRDVRLLLRLPAGSSQSSSDTASAIVQARPVWHRIEGAQHVYGMSFAGDERDRRHQLRDFVDFFNANEAPRAAAV